MAKQFYMHPNITLMYDDGKHLMITLQKPFNSRWRKLRFAFGTMLWILKHAVVQKEVTRKE
jgi:hypothetical protein